MKIRFIGATQLANAIYRFDFEPPVPLRYLAGQFVELHIPHSSDDRGDRRWLSLSSSPTEKVISFTTKIPPKPSSFKRVLRALQPKQEVSISEPMGDFVLPRISDIPLIFVAAGVGISPIRSISKFIIDSADSRKLAVLYVAKDKTQHCYLEEVRQAGAHVTLTTDTLNTKTVVRFCALQQKMIGFTPARIYLSGPEKMVDQQREALIQAAFDPRHIITDAFTGYDSL